MTATPLSDEHPNDEGSIIVGSFAKNAREAICVGMGTWKGRQLIFVRTYVQAIGEDMLIPTREGISLPASAHSELLNGIRALGDVMAASKVVARIPKNRKEEVWIGINTYRDVPLIYIRTFVRGPGAEDWSPTKKGISIRVELYPRLLEAVEKLGRVVEGAQSAA